MTMFTLAPDEPCDWAKVMTQLKSWNPAIRQRAEVTPDKAILSLEIPQNEQKHLRVIFELQELLTTQSLISTSKVVVHSLSEDNDDYIISLSHFQFCTSFSQHFWSKVLTPHRISFSLEITP